MADARAPLTRQDVTAARIAFLPAVLVGVVALLFPLLLMVIGTSIQPGGDGTQAAILGMLALLLLTLAVPAALIAVASAIVGLCLRAGQHTAVLVTAALTCAGTIFLSTSWDTPHLLLGAAFTLPAVIQSVQRLQSPRP